MSYDIHIGPHWLNYTYNLGKLWHDYMPRQPEKETGLWSLHGLTGKQAANALEEFFTNVNRDCHDGLLRKYDAPNGWGNLEGALVFSALLMAACRAHPKKIVEVS